MRIPKIYIVFRKDNGEEEDRAKEIQKIFCTAAQMMSKQIDIEITSNVKDFRDYSIKIDEMPVVIVNNQLIFTKHVPPVELVKQLISTPKEQQNFF